jgi:hypothetical protein
MWRKIEVSATTDPSTDTRGAPPRDVRNHGRIFCKVAMRFPSGTDWSSSKRVTTELAADEPVRACRGLVRGIDGCEQPLRMPTINNAADGDLIAASLMV